MTAKTKTHTGNLSLLLLFALIGSITPQVGDAQATKPTAKAPSGIWEYEDSAGGAVGINLWEARQPSWHDGPPLKGEQLNPLTLQIGVYHRKLANVRCGEENFFDAGWKGPSRGVIAAYSDGVLRVWTPEEKIAPRIEVELAFDPTANTWKGRFHRGNFDKTVTLRRVADRVWHDGQLCMATHDEISPLPIHP
jgi:hypothetical protein